MKNKKKTYFLLLVVLTIWGLLVYQFFSFTASDDSLTTTNTEPSVKPLAITKREPIVIDVHYRDPFLGKMYLPGNSLKVKPGSGGLKKKEPVVWPEVIYKGLVSDSKNKKKVFMVIISGKTYLMKEKDTEQEITLKKGNRESIDIKFKGELYNILIQQ